MTPANSTLASHALRWDARPRIAVADGKQWFAPANHDTHLQPEASTSLALVHPSKVSRLPGDRPAPRQWNPNKPGRKLTKLRRHREIVP